MAPLAATVCSLVTVRIHKDAYLTVVLLKSPLDCSLQLTDMQPSIIDIADTYEDALVMQSDHAVLLKKLAENQFYLEQLLFHSDDINLEQQYTTDGSNMELYEAITGGLEEAWNELVAFLQVRTMILQEVVQFYEKYEQALRRMKKLSEISSDLRQDAVRRRKSRVENTIAEALGLGEAIIYRLIKISNQSDILDDMKRAVDASCRIETMMLSLLKHWNDLCDQLTDNEGVSYIATDYGLPNIPDHEAETSVEQTSRDATILQIFEAEFAEAWSSLSPHNAMQSSYSSAYELDCNREMTASIDMFSSISVEAASDDMSLVINSECDATMNQTELDANTSNTAIAVAECFLDVQFDKVTPVEVAEKTVDQLAAKPEDCNMADNGEFAQISDDIQEHFIEKRSQTMLNVRETEFYFISLVVLLFMLLTLVLISTVALFGDDVFPLGRY